MSDESQLQVRPKDGNSSLTVSNARSSLIARGRREVEAIAKRATDRVDPQADLPQRAEEGDAEIETLAANEKGLGLEALLQESAAQAEAGSTRLAQLAAPAAAPQLEALPPRTVASVMQEETNAETRKLSPDQLEEGQRLLKRLAVYRRQLLAELKTTAGAVKPRSSSPAAPSPSRPVTPKQDKPS